MDGGAWWASPWGRSESDTTEQLHFHFHALEKEMATHASVLAWRVPGMAEPGGLQSTGLQSVGHKNLLTPGCHNLMLYNLILRVFYFLHWYHS